MKKKVKLIVSLLLSVQLSVTTLDAAVIANAETTTNSVEESNTTSAEQEVVENPYYNYQCMDDPTEEELREAKENSMSLEELEYYTGKNKSAAYANMQSADASLPTNVDLSQSKYFPKAENQIGGTCWAYSTVYYQASYEYNKLYDIESNNKNSLSPLFVHNIRNSLSVSGGGTSTWAYNVLSTIGAPTYEYSDKYLDRFVDRSNMPSNYFLNWCTDADTWKMLWNIDVLDIILMKYQIILLKMILLK